MPTIKKRVHITVNDEIAKILKLLAKRDGMPEATKAGQLLMKAIEAEEDEIWNMIAEERDTKDAEYLSHNEAWAA